MKSVQAEQESAEPSEWHVLEDRNKGVQLQSDLEKKIFDFFDELTREWNPCRDDSGRWRYRWDREVGAHDV